jgi:hypothetical protein
MREYLSGKPQSTAQRFPGTISKRYLLNSCAVLCPFTRQISAPTAGEVIVPVRIIRNIILFLIFAGLTYAQPGLIATYAGNGSSIYTGDGVAARSTGIHPFGMTLDTNGNLYIADTQNARILRVDAGTKLITTAAGGGTGDDGVKCVGE